MILTQLDKDLQDIIIQKIHGVGLEEARQKELINGCLLTNGYSDDTLYMFTYMEGHAGKEFAIFHRAPEDPQQIYWSKNKYEIIGLPPSLDRVLYALGSNGLGSCFIDGSIMTTDGGCRIREYVCDWKLLNDDGTPATLRDQSIETKEKIYQLIK